MRFFRRSLVGLFILSLTLALFAVAGTTVYRALETRWSEDTRQPPARERVFAVNVVTITPETVSPVITTYGEIRSRRNLEIRAPASGEIIWLSDDFDEGAEVDASQPLLRIDDADAIGRRDTARADLDEAQNELRDARRALALANDELKSALDQLQLRERALARQEDLRERGVGTEAAVETAALAKQSAEQAALSRRISVAQAEARVDQAASALDRRQIALAEAERRLNETLVTAPFDGTLGSVEGTLGGLVAANERLADLLDPASLEVSFRLSASQYARLLDADGRIRKADVTVSLDIADLDIVASGRITRESPAVGEGQTGRLLFARLDAAPGFRPGDFVTVRVTEPPLDEVAVLPATAVDAAGTVLAVGPENRLEIAEVTLLRRQGNDVIVRASGLAGRDVVAERTPLLGQGIGVRPIRPGDEAAPEGPEMVELDAERRARLIAFVEASERMPQQAKERVLAQLQQKKVPARVVKRLEARMGG